jgi:iron complex outermembrane receptor protein
MAGRGALACLVALAAAAGSARAQARPDTLKTDTAVADTPAAAVYRLPALEATVARGLLPLQELPMATTTVDRRVIRRAHATVGLDEALAGVPGLEVDNRYNLALGSRISIRGFGARAAFGVRGIRILVDGIPLTLPDGQATLTNIDLGSAGRIQVLRGPSSLLYGNAAGGVISIETEVPDAPRFAQGRVVVGNYGTANPTDFWKVQVNAGGRSRDLDYIAGLSHMSLHGFREHSAARRLAFNGKLRYAPDDASQLTLIVNVADVPLAQNPGSLPADTARLRPQAAWPANVATRSGEASTQGQAGVRYERRLGPGAFDVMVYGLGRSVGTALPFRRFIRLHRRSGGARGTYRAGARVGGRPVTLAAGFDADVQRDDRRETDNVGGQPGDSVFRDELDRVTAMLDVTGGVRYDATSFTAIDHLATAASDNSGTRTLSAFSGTAGAVLHATEGLSVYASVSSSFQTPTTTELLNAPPVAGNALPSGFNPDLRPQTALSVELGARGRVDDFVSGQVSIYTMDVRDALVPFQIASVPGRDFYRNAGRSRRRGLELGIDVRLSRRVTVNAAYTFSDFTFLDDGLPDVSNEGNRIPGVPKNRFTATVTWSGEEGFLAVQGRAFDRLFVDDGNTAADPPDGSGLTATFDIRAGARIRLGTRVLAPFLALQNITAVRYNASVVVNAAAGRYYEPAPGRAFLLGATLTAR